MSKVRVLGIGSPSGDDQAGWLVVDALLAGGALAGEGIAIEKLDRPGAALVSCLEHASRIILVDAMQGGYPAGTIRHFDRDGWPAYGGGLSSHGFDVPAALALARELGGLPPRLDLYGIEIGSAMPGEAPGAAVKAAARHLAVTIARSLKG